MGSSGGVLHDPDDAQWTLEHNEPLAGICVCCEISVPNLNIDSLCRPLHIFLSLLRPSLLHTNMGDQLSTRDLKHLFTT